VRDDFRAGCGNDCLVAAGMIAVFVRVQYLRNRPVILTRNREALHVVKWVDRECVTGFRAHHEVIKIAIGVASPDLPNDHSLPR
jgi:hypothetical protein